MLITFTMLYCAFLKGNNNIKKSIFSPQKISLEDDAGHKPNRFTHIETWYFDAIFENNYSMLFTIGSLPFGKKNNAFFVLHLYNNSNLIKQIKTLPISKTTYISEEHPLIKIDDKQILKGYKDDSGNLTYNISFESGEYGIDLTCKKSIEGWKGNHLLGPWFVVPRYTINGTIKLDGKDIPVKGVGYHDHNIFPLLSPFLIKGYHWGSFGGKNLNVVWANIIKNKSNEQAMAVVNEGNDKFLLIDQKDIYLKIIETIKDHGKIIPKKFSLKIDKGYIKVNVTMETVSVHFMRYPLIKLWRNRIRTNGKILKDGRIENINSQGFSELLKFF